jgi:glycosyltransferase involved in cell wall biosynthesis
VRVIYFSNGYTTHDHRFLSALALTDHEVYFLQLEPSETFLENQPLPNKIHPLEWEEGLGTFRLDQEAAFKGDLIRIVNEVNPELIHAGPVQSCAYLVALAGYKPLLTMSWGSDILQDAKSDPGRSEAIFTLAQSSLFACDCETVAAVAQELGMARERIVIFPWGVDLDHFSPGEFEGVRSMLGGQDTLVLLSTRALENIYGVDILVDAFIHAVKVEPKLRLLMLNEGSLQAELEKKLRTENLEDRVYFAGRIDLQDLPNFYRAADFYVSASRSDGSSISLLESMASGLPAIVSNIPGNREWVEPGTNGWWFEDGDSDSLRATILLAIEETDHKERYGRNARQIAEGKANWEFNFQCLLGAYERINEMNKETV